MNPIVLALLDDPAILALRSTRIVDDVVERFEVPRCEAYRAVIEAMQHARDMGVYPAGISVEEPLNA